LADRHPERIGQTELVDLFGSERYSVFLAYFLKDFHTVLLLVQRHENLSLRIDQNLEDIALGNLDLGDGARRRDGDGFLLDEGRGKHEESKQKY